MDRAVLPSKHWVVSRTGVFHHIKNSVGQFGFRTAWTSCGLGLLDYTRIEKGRQTDDMRPCKRCFRKELRGGER
jgi:hypothetical protein